MTAQSKLWLCTAASIDFSGALSDQEIDNGSNPKTVVFIKKLA